jgi:VWFA-related protein
MAVRSASRALGVTIAFALLMIASATSQQPPPPTIPSQTLPLKPLPDTPPPQTFRSGVELLTVDVQVVDKKGQPITGLKPEQFEVTIDGKKRQVVSLQLIDAATGTPHSSNPAPADPAGAPSGRPISAGNLYVLAIDQGSFRALNAQAAMHVVTEFIKRLSLNDYLGIVAFPQPGVIIDPTRERAPLTAAVNKVVGFTSLTQRPKYRFTLSDAIDVSARDRDALQQVVERNCQPNDLFCPKDIEMEMTSALSNLEAQAVRSLDGLRGVVEMMRTLEGRKTLILVSAGMPSGDRTGARLYLRTNASELGKKAAESGILLYTLHMNTSFLDAFSAEGIPVSETLMRETGVYARGLDLFNGTAGGALLEVNTGPDFAVDRVIRETSAYYLLAVKPEPADHDGKAHLINVKVSQRDSSVRSRKTMIFPKPTS